MILKFTSEGGFGGFSKQVEVSSENLPEDMGQIVNRMFKNKQAFQPTEPENPYLRDACRYRLELETGGKKIDFRFNDTNVPHELQPLMHFLRQQSGENDPPP